jgi:hypothetical protein
MLKCEEFEFSKISVLKTRRERERERERGKICWPWLGWRTIHL